MHTINILSRCFLSLKEINDKEISVSSGSEAELSR